MERNDKIVILIAAAIVVIAGIGIFTWSGGAPDEDSYTIIQEYKVTVGWKENTATFSSEDTTADGETTEVTKEIDEGNLMSVMFNLSWTDDKAGLFGLKADTLKLEVTPPTGSSKSDEKEAAEGSIPLTFDVSSMPAPETWTVKAESKEEAREMALQLARENATDEKTGSWKAAVTVNVGRFITKGFDSGNDWTLKGSYSYYEPTIKDVKEETKSTGGNNDNDDEEYKKTTITEDEAFFQRINLLGRDFHLRFT